MKVGDYILITNCNDDNYLRIGEILDVTHKGTSEGIVGFDITFGEVSHYGALVVKTYTDAELEGKYKVLKFTE